MGMVMVVARYVVDGPSLYRGVWQCTEGGKGGAERSKRTQCDAQCTAKRKTVGSSRGLDFEVLNPNTAECMWKPSTASGRNYFVVIANTTTSISHCQIDFARSPWLAVSVLVVLSRSLENGLPGRSIRLDLCINAPSRSHMADAIVCT